MKFIIFVFWFQLLIFISCLHMISFMTEGVEAPNLDMEKIWRWINEVVSLYGKRAGNINYCFCNDSHILDTNIKFLGHDYFTDIITFDYSYGDRVAGDLVISLDTVRSNALLVGATYEKELLRVVIHGVLHLCGIDDKGPGQREIMEHEENRALALYENS